MNRFITQAALLLAIVAAGGVEAGDLQVSLDHSQISNGDTVQLSLTHDGQAQSRPDLTPLQRDFDIVGRSSSSRIEMVNGQISSSTQLQLTLAPKHAGQLTIPALSWDSDRSSALTLMVANSAPANAPRPDGSDAAADAAANGDGRVFLETEAAPRQPYVQGEVEVTVRLYAAEPLSNASLSFDGTDSVSVRQLGDDSHSTVMRNGRSYAVITRHYALFPQASGPLRLPGPVLSGEISDRDSDSDPFSDLMPGFAAGVFGSLKPIRLHAQPVELDVKPRPAAASSGDWLPATSLTAHATWEPERASVNAGDPVFLTLDVQANGLSAAQLPDLSTQLDLPAGLKSYADPPQLIDTSENGELHGERRQRIALIADQAGPYAVPTLQLKWWNTRTDRVEPLVIPGRTLIILPAAGSRDRVPATAAPSASTPAAEEHRLVKAVALAPGNGRRLILVAAGLAAALLLASAIAWRGYRRHRARNPRLRVSESAPRAGARASEAKAAFLTACAANDPHAARRALLQWFNSANSGPRIAGLEALADCLADERLIVPLQDLDRACYAGGAWRGDELSWMLASVAANRTQRSGSQVDTGLAPLYP